MQAIANKTKTAMVSVLLLWDLVVEILDWVGRLGVVRDLLPSQLEFLISGWFRTILLSLILFLILYRRIGQSDVLARMYAKFGVKHRMISYVIAIAIGMAVGGLVGCVIWWQSSKRYAVLASVIPPKPPTSLTASSNGKLPTAEEIAKEVSKELARSDGVENIRTEAKSLIYRLYGTYDEFRKSIQFLDLSYKQVKNPEESARLDRAIDARWKIFQQDYERNYHQGALEVHSKLLGNVGTLPNRKPRIEDSYKTIFAPTDIQDQLLDLRALLNEMEAENKLSLSCGDIDPQWKP